MKRSYQLMFVVLAPLFAVSCSSSNNGGITLKDFQDEVKLVAGPGAADCGHVVLGADRSAVNCCVASNFVQFLPFSVTFDEQGIDSQVASGIALDASGSTTIFLFDSDFTGGNQPDNGVINRQICVNPALTQNPCSDPTGFPLTCD